MAELMLQYIKEQPEVWERILGHREIYFSAFAENMKDMEIGHLLFIGSGSSYIASLMAADFAVLTAGIDCSVYTPAGIRRQCRYPDKASTLVVASSQSGKSISTLEAINKLKAEGYRIAGVTSDASSPIARLADVHYLIECGPETVGPKTKGMTGTILLLDLLVLAAAQKAKRLTTEAQARILLSLQAGITAGISNITLCEDYCRSQAAAFREFAHAVVIADPAGELTAREGALKLLETWYVPVSAYEIEEYTHGIQNIIQAGICNLFTVTEETSRESMERLVLYSSAKGCRNWVISTVSNFRTDAEVLQLHKGTADYTIPFEILPAFQYLSAYGSEDRKINCDRPKFDDFYGYMGTKSK